MEFPPVFLLLQATKALPMWPDGLSCRGLNSHFVFLPASSAGLALSQLSCGTMRPGKSGRRVEDWLLVAITEKVASHIEIGQSKQHTELAVVFVKPFVANFAKAPSVLHHTESVFSLSANPAATMVTELLMRRQFLALAGL